jgi:hypothetical protein
VLCSSRSGNKNKSKEEMKRVIIVLSKKSEKFIFKTFHFNIRNFFRGKSKLKICATG